MDEATRAAFYQAEEELEALLVPGILDRDDLERAYLDDRDAGAEMLAKASNITVAEAKALLQRVYGM